jgi:hypothetical protein
MFANSDENLPTHMKITVVNNKILLVSQLCVHQEKRTHNSLLLVRFGFLAKLYDVKSSAAQGSSLLFFDINTKNGCWKI